MYSFVEARSSQLTSLKKPCSARDTSTSSVAPMTQMTNGFFDPGRAFELHCFLQSLGDLCSWSFCRKQLPLTAS